jgi:NCS1 family nucleobase:cation symporter-1
VPALSLKQALLVIVIASVAGCALLGVAAAIGTDARVPAMVLMRAPLGQRGSYLATGLNVVQCLGWSTYELIIIASASAALSDRVFGFRAQWLWTILFGAVAVGLAFLGPIGFIRRYVRKFAVWFVIASLGYLTWWVVDKSDLTAFWHANGKGGFPTFWQGVDLMLASVISVDAARRRLHALRADAAIVVLGRVGRVPGPGRLALLARRAPPARPRHLRPGAAAGCRRLRRGGVGARTLRGDRGRERRGVRERLLDRRLAPERDAAGVAAAADRDERRGRDRPVRSVLNLSDFATFLFLLGSFFVPLLGVLIADWLLEGRHYTRDTIFHGPAFRPEMILAWIVGFGLFQWLSPQGPGWWTGLLGHTESGAIRLHRLAAELRRRVRAGSACGRALRRPARALAET